MIIICNIPQKSPVFTTKNLFKTGLGVTKEESPMTPQFNTDSSYKDRDSFYSLLISVS